jgi:hypothetical protein
MHATSNTNIVGAMIWATNNLLMVYLFYLL